MIDESLLFQMGYRFPPIATTDIVLALVLMLVLGYFFFFYTKNTKPQKMPVPSIPDVDHPRFEESLAEHIRVLLANAYAPAHARAHTASEIARYAGDHPLLSILRELEQAEYTSQSLSGEQRNDILSRVSKSKKKTL